MGIFCASLWRDIIHRGLDTNVVDICIGQGESPTADGLVTPPSSLVPPHTVFQGCVVETNVFSSKPGDMVGLQLRGCARLSASLGNMCT